MPSVRTVISTMVLGALGVGCPSPRSPAALGADVCLALAHGEERTAGELVSEMTLGLGDRATEASIAQLVADWLKGLPCAADVAIAKEIIDTLPGIQEIRFSQTGGEKRYVVDVVLAPPFRARVHAGDGAR